MRIAKTVAAAAVLALTGGTIAQAQVRDSAPVESESDLTGINYGTQFLVIALVAGVIAGLYAITDDDDDDEPISA